MVSEMMPPGSAAGLPWRQRLRLKLFPTRSITAPPPPWNSKSTEVISVESITQFGWADRFRILATGRVRFAVRITTERRPGGTVVKGMAHPITKSWKG